MKRYQSKRHFSIVLVVAMVLTMLVSNFVPAYAEANEEITITLLSTSDVHGRYMPWDYAIDGSNPSGSFAQISTAVKEVRKENPNTILLDAGDTIQDNSAELFKEMDKHPAMLAMNTMGYDAWTMGNHEFDYGFDILDNITKQFNGAVLGGNVYKDNGARYFDAYTIVEREGIKVGIIGMTTPMVVEFKEDTDTFEGKEVRNAVEETKEVIKELEGKVDVIVGLMHMGMDNENNNPDTGVADLANACPEIAAIFAGHMHKLHEEDMVNGVLIVEPNKYATDISRVDLTFVKENDKFILKDKKGSAIKVGEYDVDPELEKVLNPFHEIARDDANTIIGELQTMDFVAEDEIKGIPTVQIQETPLTNFFSEVMLHYSNGADVVAHQIDNDKAGLNVGPIKKKDISYNYQYAGGEVTVYKVTGKDLKDYMEWSVDYFNTSKPGDVTVSFNKERRASKYSTNDIFGGVKYEIDLSKDYGNRIVNLRHLDDTAINPEDEIKLGLNAYRMKALIGKGGPLEDREFEQIYSTQDEAAYGEIEGRIRNLAARYIQDVKNGVYEGKLNNTWKIVGVDTDAPVRKDIVELINEGILEVPKTEDGKYTNIASINIQEPVTEEEINTLSEKVGLDPSLFKGIENKGEFYEKLNASRKEIVEEIIEEPTEELVEEPVEELVEKPEEKPAPEEQTIYTVKSGDVLYRIALEFETTWQKLAEYNKIKNPHRIYPGQEILIP
ncbi:5'-nucleotidase C-terminal domain-containing protein [Tissierella sp. MB52-C2]|uniref:5'-nucleotidase C-terminal domain-containing protein n=1 Tax=Tissierella sp. MB52-C2 TaxID=3070999 RepID=UPI00280C0C79|nr:5'-nucleotidase C-terminal domain-containing protein [Tissierella sp. MB52-C2]WMM24312.1 5'-nucleotidase C-terminal domain-containing protein [Tissierella sp. MB52-C2]